MFRVVSVAQGPLLEGWVEKRGGREEEETRRSRRGWSRGRGDRFKKNY